jgi:TolB-like protein
MRRETFLSVRSNGASLADGRLESWKGIAVYLNREVRTVQRWEREENLPVHRHLHRRQGTVYAYRSELDSWLVGRQPKLETERSAPMRVTLAVLPFENLSGDSAQDYFSDGLTEEMIARLGGLQPDALGVIAWTSVRAYKNKRKTIKDIGRDLGVGYVIEGSVRREGNRARISAQLIRVDDQTHLWAETYDRELSSILAVHGEVAREVAREIRLTLSPETKADLAKMDIVQPEAYELYLLGRQEFNRWSPQGFTHAAEYFEEGIRKDPNYALPQAWLALCYDALAFFEYVSPRDAYPKCRAAASRALEIDSSLVQARLALAWADFAYDWNWDTAQQEFQQVLRSNPNSWMAHWLYAWFLTSMGDEKQARTEILRALELDPFNPFINTSFGDMLELWRRHDDALEQYQKTLKRVPEFPWPYHLMADIYAQQKRYEDAVAAERKYLALSGCEPEQIQSLERTYATSGGQGYWTWQLQRLEDQARQIGKTPSAQLAIAHAQLGERDAAFKRLEKAYADRAGPLILLNVNPVWDPLRHDSRFTDILCRLNFPN